MTRDVCPVMLLRCPDPPRCRERRCQGDPSAAPISEDVLPREQQLTLRRVEREVAALKAKEAHA